MSVREELIEGRAKIADPKDWAPNPLSFGSRECAVTAVGSRSRAYRLLCRIAGVRGNLGDWNDEHTCG